MGFLNAATWTCHWHAHFLFQQGDGLKNDLVQLGLISEAVPAMLQASGLEWPWKNAERILSSTPQPKRRGRPQGPVTSRARKRSLSFSL